MSSTRVSSGMIQRARSLRRNRTSGEEKLWRELRNFRFHYGVHARKQAPIGPYVVDFVVHAAKLIIEVDGEFHLQPDAAVRDRKRDDWLQQRGYRILRFSTGDLADSFDGCIHEVLRALNIVPM